MKIFQQNLSNGWDLSEHLMFVIVTNSQATKLHRSNVLLMANNLYWFNNENHKWDIYEA